MLCLLRVAVCGWRHTLFWVEARVCKGLSSCPLIPGLWREATPSPPESLDCRWPLVTVQTNIFSGARAGGSRGL